MFESSPSEVVLILVLGTFAMIILALGIFFFFLIYQKRLHLNELKLNRIKAEHQQELLKTTVLAEEQERKRFAADLHDEAGAMLSAIKLNLSQIEKKAAQPETGMLAKESKKHIDEVISQIRRISRALMPPSLEKFGLVNALGEMVNWINNSDETEVILWARGEDNRFGGNNEITVYRIVQELINNALKHAEASVITVKIRCTASSLCFSVADNGKGFSPGSNHPKGLGLKNLESRSEMLKASFKIKSEPGKGTTAVFYMPLAEKV